MLVPNGVHYRGAPLQLNTMLKAEM